jgi:hypothetical protein
MPILGILDSAKTGRLTNFTSIATFTATGGETSTTFSSIPGTYTDLQIRGIVRSTSASNSTQGFTLRFNGDSASNYSYHNIVGDSSAASTGAIATDTNINYSYSAMAGNTANVFAPQIVDISDYASTTKYKTIKSISGNETNTSGTVYSIGMFSGNWRSTAAITSITLTGVTLVAGSTFALYGVKASA